MRQILTILTTLCLIGCTLSQSVKTDITPMPTLRLGYKISQVQNIRAYVFDERGVLLQDLRDTPSAEDQEIRMFDLLKGVAQKSYTVVSYANCSMMNFAPMVIGESHIEDLALQFEQNNPREQFPDLLYSKEEFQVTRTKEIQTKMPTLGSMHHQIELIVTGLETADVPISAYRAELSALPLAYNALGESNRNEGLYTPHFSIDEQGIKDSFRVFHLNSSGFHLRFWEGSRSLVDVQITPSAETLSQSTIQVKIVILSAQIILSVGDWQYVTSNTPDIGG